ncbi:hypothetical protein CIK75_11125 [Glutamicibacter sp. BW78]|nr:hypothetical protein CIK75_11125 [Glutamicibacter sp. BW78]
MRVPIRDYERIDVSLKKVKKRRHLWRSVLRRKYIIAEDSLGSTRDLSKTDLEIYRSAIFESCIPTVLCGFTDENGQWI